MRFRVKLVLAVFGLLYLICGILMVLYSLNVITLEQLRFVVLRMEYVVPGNVLLGLAGVILILMVITLLNFVWAGIEAEKNIAFRTDYGEVLISLSAIEEYIRKFLRENPEIKELRTKVSAKKRLSWCI